ncbi:hypothetical protein [Crossiella sp. CA198]|uniref:hypothetical protein n=1 Tax=Crossiella sp. CA198 TaxID=3455607 RepID=UPI003F8D12DA
MSFRERSFTILESVKSSNYSVEELSSVRDGQIRDLLLDVAGEMSFEQVKQLMPRDVDRVLGTFAERAASIAVRHQDARELRAGLLAAAIALSVTGDFREELPVLALLYRAAEMIGNDPDLEFSEICEKWSGLTREFVDFPRRIPEDKTIQAMGYKEGDDKSGFRFLRTW